MRPFYFFQNPVLEKCPYKEWHSLYHNFLFVFKIFLKNGSDIFISSYVGIFMQTATEASSNQCARRDIDRLTLFVWIFPSRYEQKMSLPVELYYEVLVAGESKE